MIFLDLKLIFIIIIANKIIKIPNHCEAITLSFRTKNAIITETGNSNEATILPNPMPVSGKPILNKIGGIMVPNKEIISPHFKKIPKLNGVICVQIEKPKTIIEPPRSMYKLRCAADIFVATLLAVNMVVVKDIAANIPQNMPYQSTDF